MTSSVNVRKLTAVIVAVGALGVAASPAAATVICTAPTYDVNTTADTSAADPAVSGVDSGGNCSLRGAIEAADTDGGPDTINVPAGTYTLTALGGADQGSAGALVIGSTNVTISGTGSPIIDANFLDRAFTLDSGTATISGFTIENGRSSTQLGATNPRRVRPLTQPTSLREGPSSTRARSR